LDKGTWYNWIGAMNTDEYVALQADGWEPYHFILIPVPEAAQTGLVAPTANGALEDLSAKFVQIVGMKKWYPDAGPGRLRTDELEAITEGDLPE